MRSSILLILLLLIFFSNNPLAAEESESEKTIAVLGSSVASGWVTSFETQYDMKNGYAETCLVPIRESEIGAPDFLKLHLGFLGGDGFHQRHGVGRFQYLGLQVHQPAAHPQGGHFADRQVKVAGLLFNRGIEQAVDLDG